MTDFEQKELVVDIAARLARILLSSESVPEFSKEKIKVADVARMIGKSASWVQAGIISGWLPIGVAVLDGKRVTNLSEIRSNRRVDYTIFPKKLWEETGIIWKGRNDE